MTKKLTLSLIIILLLSCNRIKEKRNISGNWYSSSSEKLENSTIDYAEIFIKNDTIHICSEYMLRMFPRKMILKNDSLFFESKSDSNFVGNILKKTKNSFDLGINNENKRTYYKMENFKTLENLVNGEITEKKYYSEFIKRMNNRYEKLGIEN
ncbi:hypothetical protein [Polaribacter aquimarinus]|uniref:Lipocalin-like domain-containing protein n=1 Tax=Polaribacter aquimarinus TaxID=2100726 RepID=A0A2U2J6U7_9FLAO|nr:hypothetical protein [Polaribacter aquimarinus]PWG04056.1 hypothetical protein DIS07_14800 [Polaribacter aquimarinus]